MAQQNIILKRSAVAGRVPDTGSIKLGEVAINTYDGKLYFKKSGSAQSVETILTTNSTTTGSITVLGTGSFGLVQGSIQATNGVVSGSSQIDATATTNWATGIKTQLNSNTVVSGSSQLTSSYDTRYVISGSITQTTWDNIANKPAGIVSGSVQVDLTATTNFTSFSSSIASQFAVIDGGTY